MGAILAVSRCAQRACVPNVLVCGCMVCPCLPLETEEEEEEEEEESLFKADAGGRVALLREPREALQNVLKLQCSTLWHQQLEAPIPWGGGGENAHLR